MPLHWSATAGAVTSLISMACSLVALVLDNWNISQIGDAKVTAGLWRVCTVDVPFVDNGCDSILQPSAAVFSARTFAVLMVIAAIVEVVFSALVYALFRNAFMMFIAVLVPAGPVALGVLTSLSWAAAAAPVVANSGRMRYGAGFGILILSWLGFGLASALYFWAYLKKQQEPAGDRRAGAGWTANKNRRRRRRRSGRQKSAGSGQAANASGGLRRRSTAGRAVSGL